MKKYKNLSNENVILYLKAIAIVFMLYHHLFAFDKFVIPSNDWISIIGYRKLEVRIALFSKICVGIFAFITGWFISDHFTKYDSSYRIQKIRNLFKEYWPYCFGFLLIGGLLSEPLPSISEFFFNLLGIGTKVFSYGGGYINVSHAWYVSFYCLTMLVTCPILNRMRRIRSKIKVIGFFAIMGVLNITIAMCQNNFILPNPFITILASISDYTKYTPIIATGYWLREYNFDIFNNRYLKYYGVWGIVLFFLQIKVPFIFGVNMEVIYIPIFISVFLSFLDDLFGFLKNHQKVKSKIVYIMSVFGRNSTDIWFFHSVFYTPLRKLQWIAYFPRFSAFIWLWTISFCCIVIEFFKRIKAKISINNISCTG